ncbi:hypothetical protein GCM10009716_20680 [Streptomyces sodiiphilus]|uniref:Uncharacterized protein n=1 Tax=Streptomyces sodiiphilus TaxID=226217 RepID=A0ABP5AD60_9ACTN
MGDRGLVACLALLGAVRGVLRPAGAMVPAAAAAAAGVLLLTAFEGKLHAPSDDTADSASLATACREAGGLSICVHPAYRTALAGLHDVFTEELRGRLDGTPGAVDRLVQREQGHTGTPASIHLTSLRAGWQHEVESDFLASLVDGTLCVRGDMESGALTDLTAQWIAGGRAEAASLPGFSEPTDAMNRAERFLNSAPPREVNRWLAGHWELFRTCALIGSDFPAR